MPRPSGPVRVVKGGGVIDPSAVIGPDVVFVGDPDVGAHASLEGHVVVGRGVRIAAGARIGQRGFGYELDEDGGWADKPHEFGVVLHDGVDVGANTCIDRGSWRDTVIGAGSKIDNLVHVAHNVVVGEGCLIVACAEISGSVEIGDGAYVAPGARIRERLTVGAGAVVGLGAVVVKDVPARVTVAGVPARIFGPADGPPPPPRETYEPTQPRTEAAREVHVVRDFSVDRLAEMLAGSPPSTFWRHDVDVSPAAAVKMAELEAELGIVATFYVMTESPFYTPAEAAVLSIRLASLDHRVGLHIDRDQVVTDDLMRGLPVSMHCPDEYVLWRDFDYFENAYAARWEGRYVSDARGVFRSGDPEDLFDGEPLQVALHPEWWFDRDSILSIPDELYERFFHEPKRELACA